MTVSGKRKSCIFTIGLVAWSVLLCLGAVELTLRVGSWFRTKEAEAIQIETIDLATGKVSSGRNITRPSAILPYELIPNLDVLIRNRKNGVPWLEWRLATNELGHRIRPGSDTTATGKTIIFLGDSVSFGQRWNYEGTFLSRLEGKLSERCGRRVTTQNVGLSGMGPIEYLSLLKTYYRSYRSPVVVVMFYTGNDLLDLYYARAYSEAVFGSTPATLGGERKLRETDLASEGTGSRLAVLQFLEARARQEWIERHSPQLLRRCLEEMKRFAEVNECTLLLVAWNGERGKLPTVFLQAAAQTGLPLFDLSWPLYQDRPVTAVPLTVDNVHFNAEGHELAAKALTEWLTPRVITALEQRARTP